MERVALTCAFLAATVPTQAAGWHWVETASLGPYTNQVEVFLESPDGYLYVGVASGSTILFRTNNRGDSWEATSLGQLSGTAVRNLLMRSDGYLYAATDYGVYRTNDGGETWGDVSPPTGGGCPSRQCMIEASDGYIYAAGKYADMRRTNDGGSTWEPLPKPSGAYRIWSLLEAAGGVIFAGAYTGVDGKIYRSGDGCATWTEVAQLPSNPEDMIEASDGSLYAVTWNASIYRSTDGGWNWHEIPTPPCPAYFDLIQASDGCLYLGAESNIFQSRNGGATWVEVGAPLNTALSLFEGRDGYLYAGMHGGYAAVFRSSEPIPEPATLALLAIGGLAMICRRARRTRR